MTLSPAYGRDYRSKAAVAKDFYANLDFEIQSLLDGPGRYVTCAELLKGSVCMEVLIYYHKLRRVCVLPVERPKANASVADRSELEDM